MRRPSLPASRGRLRALVVAAVAAPALVAWPSPAAPAGGASGAAPHPGRDARAVIVTDAGSGRARPCGEVGRPDDRGTVTGGCVLKASGGSVELTVNGLLGRIPFARCEMSYTMHVDGRGRTVLTDVGFTGFSPCNDAIRCFDDDRVHVFRGRIARDADGRLRHVIDACFDTCMGRFEGRMETTLTRDDRRWRERADRTLAGSSGWELDGDWVLEGAELEIALPRRAGLREDDDGVA
ncbi:MAG: hypothetical protein WD993_08590 [Thermoleophilaceae bacterium]